MGVGMPAAIYLDDFGAHVEAAFSDGTNFVGVYHVGSSLEQKRDWRDVDVRVMLDDATYEAMGFGDPEHPHQSAKWVALTLAFSALGRHMTGLPIDFQIQQQTHANEKFPQFPRSGGRSALGIHTYFRHHPPKRDEGAT